MTINKVCLYIRDLMEFDEKKIIKARTGYELNIFKDDIIFVDTLLSNMISKQDTWDPVLEKQKLATVAQSIFTLDFFGDNAYTNATRFINLQSSQLAREVMDTHDVSIYHGMNLRNLKNVGGKTIYERWQLEVSVVDIIKDEIELLRIDEAQISTIQNKG